MRSSFLGLEVSKRSIQMAQKALDITGNNMGNAGVKGFTRQRIDTTSLYLNSFTYWQTPLSKLSLAGQGVYAFGVSQIRNDYIDKRYRDMVCYASEYDTKAKILKEIETSLDNIDNFGLLAAFDQLKSALQQVSLSTPDAKEMCSLVRNEAVNICSMLRSYSAELDRLLENNIVELKTSVDNANSLIDKIVQYNKSIVNEYASTDYARIASGQGVSEYGPLELLDQRNVLLDELAEYGDIQVFQNVDGSVRVTMGGVTIIDGDKNEKIVLKSYEDYNAAVLTFSTGETFRPLSGEIKAYVDMVNGHGPYAVGKYQNSEYGIPYYKDALNAFAEDFAKLMNGVNASHLDNPVTWDRGLIWGDFAYDINGDILLDINGNQVKAAVSAANIRVTDEWMARELMIGETYKPDPDNPDDPELGIWNGVWSVPNLQGSNLLRFVEALETDMNWGRASDFNGTVFNYLQFLSNRMGQGINFVENQYDIVVDTVNTLLDNRDSISAVSDTEEGINMMTYQKWYNASARIMTTLDEALDVVINRMGRVGL
ncbi:MAG: flagellar hook-associated protein FlgK [Oscillospiraceae bacterium]|jgi:flagellar hook-associated protein 1 FlgK|nr:flagellar hook-associated protein FlgK [Oscillospiraceae bacterium]